MMNFLRSMGNNGDTPANETTPTSPVVTPSTTAAAPSSFSFLSATSAPVEAAPSPATGFSFLSGGGSAAATPVASAPSSATGFSFLSAATPAPAPVVEEQSAPSSITGFSFLSTTTTVTENNETNAAPSLLDVHSQVTPTPVESVGDVRLNKVAGKVVKKKKRSTRVGVARDEGEDDRRDSAGPEELAEASAIAIASVPPPVPEVEEEAPPTPPIAHATELQVTEPLVVEEAPAAEYEPQVEAATTSFSFLNAAPVSPPVEEAAPTSYPWSTSATVDVNEEIPQEVVEEVHEVEEVEAAVSYSTDFPQSQASSPTASGDTTDLIASIHAVDSQLGQSLSIIAEMFTSALNGQQNHYNALANLANADLEITSKIASLEEQQTAFANAEDFEAAEAVGREIEILNSRLEELDTIRQSIRQQASNESQHFLYEKQAAITGFGSISSRMMDATQEAEASLSNRHTQLLDYIEEETVRVRSEEQRVEMERSHCEREASILDSESAVIDEAIASQVGEMITKRDTVAAQIVNVNAEIQRLEELLAEKRAQSAELSATLKSADTRIGEVRRKYDRQLQRIEDRKQSLAVTQRECATDSHAVEKARAALDTLVGSLDNQIAEAKLAIKWKQVEAVLAENLIRDFTANNDTAVTPFGVDFTWFSPVSTIVVGLSLADNPAVAESKAALEMAKKGVEQQEKDVMEMRVREEVRVAKIKSLVETIDALELSKKLHATAKRFKEAATAAKDLKETIATKEQLEIEQATCQEAIYKADAEIEQQKEQLEELQNAVLVAENNVLVIQLRNVEQRLAQIQAILDFIEQQSDRVRAILPEASITETGLSAAARSLYITEKYALLQVYHALQERCGETDTEAYKTLVKPLTCDVVLEGIVTSQGEDETPQEEEEVTQEEVEIVATDEIINEEIANNDVSINEDVNPVDDLLESMISAPISSSSSVKMSNDEDLLANFEEALSPTSYQEDNANDILLSFDEPIVEDIPAVVEESSSPVVEVDVEAIRLKISQLEQEIEIAAELEDYERAGELSEEVEVLRLQLESSNVSV